MKQKSKHKDGFAVSGMIYPILILTLFLIFQILFTFRSRKGILDSQKNSLLESINGENKVYTLEELSKIVNELNKKIYPVGSIYVSISSTNPKEIYGGTWEAFATGKTLVGLDTKDTDFNSIEKTGGNKLSSVTLSKDNLPSHTHSIPSLSGTANSGGAHTHTYSGTTSLNSATQNHKIYIGSGSTQAYYFSAAGTKANPNSYSWSGLASDHNHTHTFSGTTNSGGAHTHSITVNAGKTGSVGNSTPVKVSTLQPYTTIYMWKRVA